LSYIESQKRKLVDLIKYLDDAAAQQHNDDLRRPPSSPAAPTGLPSPAPRDTRRWSGGSMSAPLAPQFEEGFEAVDSTDLPSGSVLATGVNVDEVVKRGWFSGWGGAAQQ